MNIMLLASDSKKRLMQNFCAAYSNILSRHNLFSTDTTGSQIERVTKLKIRKFLSGGLGGEKQLTSLISDNELDMVIFLLDSESLEAPHKHGEVINECNRNLIPLATNLATAEMLILGLDRGDLDWRALFKS